jgi:hypothetical protein
MNIIAKKRDEKGRLIWVCECKGQTKEFSVGVYSSGKEMQKAINEWEASL